MKIYPAATVVVMLSATLVWPCAISFANSEPDSSIANASIPQGERGYARHQHHIIAKTPPMGFNTWNNFGPNYDEKLLLEIADAIVFSGMRDVGYKYVSIDDAWQKYPGSRDDHPGDLEADPVKFPHGIKYVADYLHARGLKLGFYSGGDKVTCAGFTGSLGHEEQDAKTFASWGVDLLKYDSCCNGGGAGEPGRPSEDEMRAIQAAMATALKNSGRKVVMSMCNCGWENVEKWARASGGHMWRINQDIADMFDGPFPEGYYMPIKAIIDLNSDPVTNFAQYAGPGGWNDMDMLVIGLKGQSANAANMPGPGGTATEYKTHFSMWSMLSAPLLAGNDVRNMDEETRSILTNAEVIALDQDALGRQAIKVKDTGDLEWFVKPLANGDVAAALLNAGADTASMTLNFKEDAGIDWRLVKVRNLWEHAYKGRYKTSYTTDVASHETVVLRLSRGHRKGRMER